MKKVRKPPHFASHLSSILKFKSCLLFQVDLIKPSAFNNLNKASTNVSRNNSGLSHFNDMSNHVANHVSKISTYSIANSNTTTNPNNNLTTVIVNNTTTSSNPSNSSFPEITTLSDMVMSMPPPAPPIIGLKQVKSVLHDLQSRAKTVRIGKVRWPPPLKESETFENELQR